MSELKTKASAGVKFTSLSVVSVSLLQMIQLIVLGRLLGPEIFGLIALIQIVIQFSQLLMDMGITDAIVHKEKISRTALSSLYWFSIAAGIVLFCLLLVAAPFIGRVFQAPELTMMIQVVGISFIIIPFGLQFQTLAVKRMDFKDLTKVEVVATVCGTIVTLALVIFFHIGVWAVVWGYLAMVVMKTAPWVIIGFRDAESKPDIEFSWAAIKELVSFGMYRLGATAANTVNTKIDQIVIGVMLGPQLLAFYSMAINLVMQPVQKLNPVITKLSLPIFAQIQNDKKRLKKWYLFVIHLLMVLNAPLYAGLALLAPFAVPLLLGEEWLSIIGLVQILCIYALFRSLGNPSGSLFIAVGKVRWSFYWQLSLLVVIPAVVYVSALTGDIAIVAAAMAALRILLFYLNYAIRVRLIIGNCFGELSRTIAMPLLHACIMAISLYGMLRLLPETGNIQLLSITIVSGAVIYSVLLLFFEKDLVGDLKGLVKKKVVDQQVGGGMR